MCEHLIELERELLARGVTLVSRGAPWSRNCREWAYFACCLDIPALRKRLNFAPCIEDHENADPRSGTERGLCCSEHHDAIVGSLEPSAKSPLFG
jgi:hypothetical protein